jgi:competence protein ComGC
MTLIELLCVIGIIGLLTALLLPALGQAKARARRAQCINHLHEIGVGFTSFANDHGGAFPMAVPMSAGGTLEVTRSGNLIGGDFYFSFRHFQAVANELVTPGLVVCPTDTRPPAPSFAELSNSNLSFFIGVNAEFSRPGSVLAGDRNLTNDYIASSTMVRLGPNSALRWTVEMHRFKGDLLFSDGHVEEKNNAALLSGPGQVPSIATLALPSVRPSGSGAPAGSDDYPSHVFWPGSKPPTGAVSVVGLARTPSANSVWGSASTGAVDKTPPPPWPERKSTNAAPAPVPPKPAEPGATQTGPTPEVTSMTGTLMRNALGWLCPLVVLIVAAVVAALTVARGKAKGHNKHEEARRNHRNLP